MPVEMVSHDQKSHVSPYVNNLDLMNVMVSFMMLSAACDVDASAIGVT